MALARADGVVPDLRPLVARLSASASDAPIDQLITINRALVVARCTATVALAAFSIGLHATVLPSLPLVWILLACGTALALSIPYWRWIETRRALGALIYAQGVGDVVLLTVALGLTPAIPAQFNLAYLLIIVPCALFSPQCGVVMATLASVAHCALLVGTSASGLDVVVPIFLFAAVALQARFCGTRLPTASAEAESAATTAAALLTVARALAAAPTRSALLERVADLARDLAGSTWACILVRDVERDVYRIMGLASRTGELDEEILSVEFPNALVQWIIDAATDDCLEVRSTEGSPLNSAFRTRWTIGPFIGAVLRREEQPLGLLMVGQDDAKTGFSLPTKRLVMGIANQTVLALENARLLEELRVANALKTDFIGAMSHELRSPLHAVIGYADMLREEAAAEGDAAVAERVDILDRVRIYTAQLLELIQATLDLSRLESGRVPVHCEMIDLGRFVEDLRSGIPEYWRKQGVELEWMVPATLGRAELDASKVRTVVRNLIDNGCKFTEQGSVRVEIAVRFDPELTPTGGTVPADLQIAVNDTGIGIPPEHKDVIFEMFRQGDGSFSRKHGGVGLGLYIVKRLLHAIGGSVRVESQLDHGSRFEVTVPVRMAVLRSASVEDRSAPVEARDRAVG
jgi:signal transduction histidine kinase